MAEKMTWIELRRAIVARSGASQKEVSTFLDELVNQIGNALHTDKVIRISGLGSFKLQAVAARKSVNVVTGEAIIIPGYDKVVFVPEAGVKELFLNLKEAPLNTDTAEPAPATPLQKLGAQADEIVGLLADLGQSPNKIQETEVKEESPAATEPVKPIIPEAPAVTAAPVAPVSSTAVVEPVAPQPVTPITLVAPITPQPVTPVAPITPQPTPVPTPVPTPITTIPTPTPVSTPVPTPITTIPTPTPEPEKPIDFEDPKPKRHFLRDTLITLLILLLLLTGAFFFFRHELTNWVDSLREKMQTPTEQVDTPTTPADTTAAEQKPATKQTPVVETKKPAETEKPANSEKPVVETPPTKSVKQETPIETVEEDIFQPGQKTQKPVGEYLDVTHLRRGEGLSQVARRYYGHGDLWVFIYEANINNLDDPDNVPAGTRLVIPNLTEEQKDINNPETRQKIHELNSIFSMYKN